MPPIRKENMEWRNVRDMLDSVDTIRCRFTGRTGLLLRWRSPMLDQLSSGPQKGLKCEAVTTAVERLRERIATLTNIGADADTIVNVPLGDLRAVLDAGEGAVRALDGCISTLSGWSYKQGKAHISVGAHTIQEDFDDACAALARLRALGFGKEKKDA